MAIAALTADGTSEIADIEHVDRGEGFEDKLSTPRPVRRPSWFASVKRALLAGALIVLVAAALPGTERCTRRDRDHPRWCVAA